MIENIPFIVVATTSDGDFFGVEKNLLVSANEFSAEVYRIAAAAAAAPNLHKSNSKKSLAMDERDPELFYQLLVVRIRTSRG